MRVYMPDNLSIQQFDIDGVEVKTDGMRFNIYFGMELKKSDRIAGVLKFSQIKIFRGLEGRSIH